jgi:small conductance mechanosensitive channel
MEDGATVVSKVGEWLAVNGIKFLVDLFVVVLIVVVGKLVISWCCKMLRASLQKTGRVSTLLENFITNVVSKILWILVILVAVQRFGVEVGPFIAGLGVTGFIIGFAFQESLGNLAAGMMIALNKPFTAGDFVEVGGNSGVVQDMNMMATTLTTPDNKKIVVPNKNVWGSPITNYTALDTRRVDLVAGISYGADINKAKEVILGVLKEHPAILDDPAPMVEVTEMADSSINLTVRPWCKTADYWSVFFSVNHAVKEALDNAGIEIPFPQMDVHHHRIEALKS